MMKAAVIGYVALIVAGWKLRKIDPDKARRAISNMSLVIDQWYGAEDDVRHFAGLVASMGGLEPEPVSRFEVQWEKFLSVNGLL